MNPIRERLLAIAGALERWPSVSLDTLGMAVASTPLGAMLYLVVGIPLPERAAVYAVMPILSDDFAEAAQQIREAANTVM